MFGRIRQGTLLACCFLFQKVDNHDPISVVDIDQPKSSVSSCLNFGRLCLSGDRSVRLGHRICRPGDVLYCPFYVHGVRGETLISFPTLVIYVSLFYS